MSETKKHTYEQVSARFRLSESGDLVRIGTRSKAKLGTTKRDGFVRVIFEGVAYQVSHLVYMLKNKQWPEGLLCYRDGNRSNVNLFNLEELPFKSAGKRTSIKIKSSDGNVFNSVAEAARAVGVSDKSIRAALKYNSTSAGKKWGIV